MLIYCAKTLWRRLQVVSGKEIWVEVNANETKHMLMFHELNVGQKGKPENIIWLFFMRFDNDFPLREYYSI